MEFGELMYEGAMDKLETIELMRENKFSPFRQFGSNDLMFKHE